MKDNSPQVAQEADRLERALAAAGLDPDDAMSYPVWNIFTNKGLRPALAAIEQRSTTAMQQSFRGVESAEYERARARFNAALTPTAREQIAAAENLVRVAKATTTTRSAAQRSTAEILADLAESQRRTTELLAQFDGQQAQRQAAEVRRAVEQTALAELEQKAAKLAKEQGISQVDAYSRVLAAEPALYDRYERERLAGRYAPAPRQPAPAPKLKPAEATIERLAAERATRDGTTREQAYVKVLAERPELYSAYVNEVTP